MWNLEGKQTIEIDTKLTSMYFLTCPNHIINEPKILRTNTSKNDHIIIDRALNMAFYLALKYSTQFFQFLCSNI